MILAGACPASAQKPKIETFGFGDGLPNLAITDLAQDSAGRLWILSFAGISVYGGETFETYSRASGLPEEELGALEIDAEGGIWTVTRWTGPRVYRFDGERWRPLPAPAAGDAAQGLTSLAVLPASGIVAVGASSSGLWLWDGAGWSRHSVGDPPAVGVRALAVFEDAIAVGTGGGLCLVEDLELDCGWREREPRLGEPILGLDAVAGESGKTRLWIFAESWLGYIEDGRLRLAADDLSFPGALAKTRGSVQVDAAGGVYFGIEQQLFFLGPERRRIDRIGLREGLATDGVTSLLLDRESNVWVASLRGLSKIESRRFSSFDEDSGLLEDEVTAVIATSPGKLVLGHNLGLSFFGTAAGTASIETLRFDRTPAESLDAYRVMDLALDRDGTVWVAAHRMGLLRLGKGRTPERRSPPGEKIYSVEVDAAGTLWACGVNQLYRGDGSTWSRVEHGQGDVGGCRWLASGPDGGLYVSTARGLLWTDGSTWHLAPGPTVEANMLYGLLPAATGEVWVGTRAGLYRLEGGELVEVADGALRIDQPVYLIFEDGRGRTWFGTGEGVRVWDGRALRHLSVRHGLAGWETNRGAGWIDDRGRVWVGTHRGLSMYQERYDLRREVAPRVEVHAVEAGGRSYPPDRRIDLSHRQNTLVFHVDTIAFSREEPVVYRYRLEGFEADWQGPAALPPAGIRYTNVPPGSYRLRVAAGWRGGSWSSEATSAPIVVARPFWRQPWFHLLAVLAVAAAGFGGHAFRTRRIRAHNLQLGALNSRLRGLLAERQELIDDLQAKNVALERFTYTVSHDLKSPLVTIRGFLGYLVRDATAGETERMRRDVERIKAATTTMGRLLDELLELSRIGRMLNPAETVPLAELAAEAAELASVAVDQSGAAVSIAADLPAVRGDRPRLLEVLQNLIENAAKFMGGQPSPRIEVGVRAGGAGDPVFYVRDNGIGVDPRYQEKIFGLFERLDQDVDGTGVGLAIVKRIVEFHGGRIWIESEGEGKGSTFCFTLAAKPEKQDLDGASETRRGHGRGGGV